MYRYQYFSTLKGINATQVGRYLWTNEDTKGIDRRGEEDLQGFDSFTRKVRNVFNRLTDSGYIIKQKGRTGYLLNEKFL